jgi:hypothetical protein
MEPNEHPEYQDRAALVEQAAYYKRHAVRLQAERDMLAIKLEQAERDAHFAEVELTALRERVAGLVKGLPRDASLRVDVEEALRGE